MVVTCVVAAVAALLAADIEAASGSRAFRGGVVTKATRLAALAPASLAVREKERRGYLPRDLVAHDAGKRATRLLDNSSTNALAAPVASVLSGWEGLSEGGVTPPSPTGAIGPTRFIQMVNRRYALFERGTESPLETGALQSLAGGTTSLSDAKVIWDPDTERFYYSMLDFGTNHIMFGFSKTSSPSAATDFCAYDGDFGHGSNIPDYPMLGTTDDLLVIGVNVFDPEAVYLGSDVLTITKPAAGVTCPSAESFVLDGHVAIKAPNGVDAAFAPVPVVQTDPGATGWVLAISTPRLLIMDVTKNPDGTSNLSASRLITEADPFLIPPDAPQPGTTKLLTTLDGRITNAVSAIDPWRGEATGIWAQQTVGVQSRAAIRWYQIYPLPDVTQWGVVSDPSLHVFNGAIAPDRRVAGSSRRYGSSMALAFNTSSSSSFPAIQAVTKWAFDQQSPFMLIKQSPGFNEDFSCEGDGNDVCRWGDYASAASDPASDPNGTRGAVWFSNQWNIASTGRDADWRTWNGSIEVTRSYGYLRVTTSPAVPSRILVDGQIMDTWGLTWVKVPTGQHAVSFSDVQGFATPADQTVDVTENATTTVTGTFQRLALLRVVTSPALPATISVDGVRRNDWGVWTHLQPGPHEVCFGAVPDYQPPPCQNVSLAAGSGNPDVVGSYESSPGAPGETGPYGYLRVEVALTAVPTQISVNGVPADDWGLTWVKVPPGIYTISFSDVDGWGTPIDRTVNVTAGNTTEVIVNFGTHGLLRIITSPAVAGTVFVNDLPRNDWGLWTWTTQGSKRICFDSVPGYTSPPCQTVHVSYVAQTTVTGTYTPNT